MEKDLPGRMSPERDAQSEILSNARGPRLVENVRGQMIDQQTRIRSSAMVDTEHILRVTRIATLPGLVPELGYLPRPVIALVERDGDETLLAAAGASCPRVPCLDTVRGSGSHYGCYLQSRVQQP